MPPPARWIAVVGWQYGISQLLSYPIPVCGFDPQAYSDNNTKIDMHKPMKLLGYEGGVPISAKLLHIDEFGVDICDSSCKASPIVNSDITPSPSESLDPNHI